MIITSLLGSEQEAKSSLNDHSVRTAGREPFLAFGRIHLYLIPHRPDIN